MESSQVSLPLPSKSLAIEVLSEPAVSPTSLPTPERKAQIGSPQVRYASQATPLGHGSTGLVESAFCEDTNVPVAIKRLSRDVNCPVRFLEIIRDCDASLHLEGHVPARAGAYPWSGILAYDPMNPHADNPFEPGSVKGKLVLVRRGGESTFAQKALSIKVGGAAGALFVNNEDDSEAFRMGDCPLLPALMLALSDGNVAIAEVTLAENSVPPRTAPMAMVRTDIENEISLCLNMPYHPHVIDVIDAWEDGNSHVIIMELCAGGHLPKMRCADAPRVAWIAKQMLSALSHIHACGICHRDLKPDNFLLTRPLGDPESAVVLIDFSMASRARRMSVACGSRRYLAPEVLEEACYSFSRDVWSVGAMIHELLLGRLPVPGRSDSDILQHIGQFTEVVFQGSDCDEARCPAAARELLSQLLRRDPRTRPTALEALSHPWLMKVQLPSRRRRKGSTIASSRKPSKSTAKTMVGPPSFPDLQGLAEIFIAEGSQVE